MVEQNMRLFDIDNIPRPVRGLGIIANCIDPKNPEASYFPIFEIARIMHNETKKLKLKKKKWRKRG